jgi:hypothetical protein
VTRTERRRGDGDPDQGSTGKGLAQGPVRIREAGAERGTRGRTDPVPARPRKTSLFGGGSLPSTGMFPHQALSTSVLFSIRPCRVIITNVFIDDL